MYRSLRGARPRSAGRSATCGSACSAVRPQAPRKVPISSGASVRCSSSLSAAPRHPARGPKPLRPLLERGLAALPGVLPLAAVAEVVVAWASLEEIGAGATDERVVLSSASQDVCAAGRVEHVAAP